MINWLKSWRSEWGGLVIGAGLALAVAGLAYLLVLDFVDYANSL